MSNSARSRAMEAFQDLTLNETDVALFSAASHDRNPLHLSSEYSRNTSYSKPIAFGVLAALAALASTDDTSEQVVSRTNLQFLAPLFAGERYTVRTLSVSAAAKRIVVEDAGKSVLKANFEFVRGVAQDSSMQRGVAERSTPADPGPGELEHLRSAIGQYWPDSAALGTFMQRWKLYDKGMGDSHVAALMWSSYFVGMEIPGRQALFFGLDMEFCAPAQPVRVTFDYHATIVKVDRRWSLVQTKADVFADKAHVVRCKMSAFIRPDSPVSSIADLTALLPPSEVLRNNVALVVGGSRGLGAAISQALALQGCTVLLNYAVNKVSAQKVREALCERSERLEMLQGDASDPQWCEMARRHILQQYGRLDILVCNASPPIHSLPFNAEASSRFVQFVTEAISLVCVPFASFLPMLEEHHGSAVLVSSSFVSTVPAPWPQYVTAKSAVEGLFSWAAARSSATHFVVVRPPKLLTDQTNTPTGRADAQPVEPIAAAIVKRLIGKTPLTNLEILDEF